jgi:hypothetical protein
MAQSPCLFYFPLLIPFLFLLLTWKPSLLWQDLVHLGLRLLLNGPPLPHPFPFPPHPKFPVPRLNMRLTTTTSRTRLLLSGTILSKNIGYFLSWAGERHTYYYLCAHVLHCSNFVPKEGDKLLKETLLIVFWSKTTLTGESRFHIRTPQGIWTWAPCDGKQTSSPLDLWDMVGMKWDCRLSTIPLLIEKNLNSFPVLTETVSIFFSSANWQFYMLFYCW